MNPNGKPLRGCYLDHTFKFVYSGEAKYRKEEIETIEKYVIRVISDYLMMTREPYFEWPKRNIYAGTPEESCERPIYEDIKDSKYKYMKVSSGLSAKSILDLIKVELHIHRIKVKVEWDHSCQTVSSSWGIEFNDKVTIEQTALL